MTAIIVTQAALPAAEAVAGQAWSVPLSATGGVIRLTIAYLEGTASAV